VRERAAVAVIAALQGIGLLLYAGYDAVQAIRVGVTGPAEVSNPPAVVLLIVLMAAFGVGMLVVARGWWLGAGWARGPFVFAEILAALVGYQVAQTPDGGLVRWVGIALALSAVLGLVVALVAGRREA
jgi:uncharacterized membrane protein (DUF2068 family)